jgi:2-polyprenyl-6-methoxyphenol hydroxylase-like FAD-dependent oxidoreductase
VSASCYDIVTVGGGLGGTALAGAMAARGARTLVLERERRFIDRVRGEVLLSWGVAELRELGLHDDVLRRCGHLLPWLELYFGGAQVQRRDLVQTTVQGAPWLAYYHPAMQEVVLAMAAAAGADVQRGARVRGVTPGSPPRVTYEDDSGGAEVEARLVVGADGRGSLVRRWAGFESKREQPRHLFTGLLFEGHGVPDDASRIYFDSPNGRISLLFPQGGGRVRAYVGHHRAAGPPPAKEYDAARFVAESAAAGVPREWYAGATPGGPLASFDATDSWVEHPYRDGVALIGDAAATSDPTWGQGMSLTLRDARTLRDCLLAGDDWDAGGHAYAQEHDRYAAVVRTVDDWYSRLFVEPGPEADARREAALPLIAADPTRLVDVPSSGPEVPIDDAVRRRFFGEDA